jgi:hypothetical protein
VTTINLELVKQILWEIDPNLNGVEEDESYQTAIVLLSALSKGPDTTRFVEFTGLPRPFIATIREGMIRAELWTESETNCDHWFIGDSGIRPCCFWPDVLVAEGLFVRQWVEEEGNFRYWAKEFASQVRQRRRAN